MNDAVDVEVARFLHTTIAPPVWTCAHPHATQISQAFSNLHLLLLSHVVFTLGFQGDGQCDDYNNREECAWDGGDVSRVSRAL